MSNKKITVALVVVAIIAIGGYVFPSVSSQIKQEVSGQIQEALRSLGANSGPDSTNECTSQNGVQVCKTRKILATATTTPCAIKSPAATSTLAYGSVQITTASSTQTTWTVAKATTPYATTTPLFGNFTLSSGVKGVMNYFASSTTATVDNLDVISPSTYVVWGVAGTVISDSSKLNGVCQATFIVS